MIGIDVLDISVAGDKDRCFVPYYREDIGITKYYYDGAWHYYPKSVSCNPDTGWLCPRCDGVNAPFVIYCICSPFTY